MLIQIRDRDEKLIKMIEVISLIETFEISAARYINITVKELPKNFTDGWYIYTLLPPETNWNNCDKWRVEKYKRGHSDGKLFYEIYAEHIFCELIDESKETYQVLNSTATNAITQALWGTPWSPGIIDVEGTHDLTIGEQKSVLEILNKIAKRWWGELYFRNDRKVDFRSLIGSDNNLWFRYDKNIKNIDVEYDAQDVVTRLYPYGRDGLTIESANDGYKYLDSEYVDDYPRPKIGELKTERTNAQNLKEFALNYLAEVEVPKITYSLDIVDLSVLTKYAAEKFAIGDIITVYDKELNLKVKTRVKKIPRRDYCHPEDSQIEIGNIVKSLIDFLLEQQEELSEFVERINIARLMVFNYLLNSRADDGFAYWQNDGWEIDNTVGFSGSSSFRAIGALETSKTLTQIIYPAHRENYVLSLRSQAENIVKGPLAKIGVEIIVGYEDETEEEFFLSLI